jgi:hypothetical protein
MLEALVDYVSTARTADGLESLLLSLLNSRNLAKDETAFNAAAAVWKKWAAKPAYDGVGPIVFYDTGSKVLNLFSNDAIPAIRATQLVYGTDVAKTLLSQPGEVRQNPYGAALPTWHRATPPVPVQHRMRFMRHQVTRVTALADTAAPDFAAADVEESPVADAFWSGVKFVGGALITGATAVEVFPVPELNSKVIAGLALFVGEVGVTLAEGYEFSKNLEKLESAPIVGPLPTEPPPGGITQDTNGSFGVFNLSVDASSTFDSTVPVDGGTSGDGNEQPPGGEPTNNGPLDPGNNQSIDPGSGGQSIDPGSGGQSIDPNSGGQSTQPPMSSQPGDGGS